MTSDPAVFGDTARVDVLLIGAGIMSATLGFLLRRLEPDWSIMVAERSDTAGAEASDSWNNAGTGHSGYCELNYTPALRGGRINTRTATRVAEQFLQSREFWSHLVSSGVIDDPARFIRPVPHMSFVEGEEDVAFLGARHAALSSHPLFAGMEYSEELHQVAEWAPLMFPRTQSGPVAAARMGEGVDVDFGVLSRLLIDATAGAGGTELRFGSEAYSLQRSPIGWRVHLRDRNGVHTDTVHARFVFIGAGGGSLPLLHKAELAEAAGLAGFPVSGRFLRCTNPDLVGMHDAKVYGKPPAGTPPMSTPHLDTRFIGGKRELVFGPFAGMTTKFLRDGSWLDFFTNVHVHNLRSLLAGGMKNLGLIGMVASQVVQGEQTRLKKLRAFVPSTQSADWEPITAGIRVQLIDRDGTVRFGTRLVSSADGTLAALLGASPGASTAVSIMLDLLARCFPDRLSSWEPALRSIIRSYRADASDLPANVAARRRETAELLGLAVAR